MSDLKLADQVAEAIKALTGEHHTIAVDAIEEMLPTHVRLGRPSKKLIAKAVADCGWRRTKLKDGTIVFRAPQLDADPLRRRGKGDNVAGQQLRQFIERIERLEEEKKGIADDIKGVYGEASSTGFAAKTMRAIVKLRKMDKHHRDEADTLLALYREQLELT